jgi:hypothetical protein
MADTQIRLQMRKKQKKLYKQETKQQNIVKMKG